MSEKFCNYIGNRWAKFQFCNIWNRKGGWKEVLGPSHKSAAQKNHSVHLGVVSASSCLISSELCANNLIIVWVWRTSRSYRNSGNIVWFGIPQSWKVKMIATCKYENNIKVCLQQKSESEGCSKKSDQQVSARSKCSNAEIYAQHSMIRKRRKRSVTALDCSISVLLLVINVHHKTKSGEKLLLCRAESAQKRNSKRNRKRRERKSKERRRWK